MSLARALAHARVFDVSPTLELGMPQFPTHPPLDIEAARTHERDGYFLQTLLLPEHAGSHVDAPAHIHADMATATIETYGVEMFIGPYKKYDLAAWPWDAGDNVPVEVLREAEERDDFALVSGDIALIAFGWDRHLERPAADSRARGWWGANAPGLSEEACRYLVEGGVKAVGSDTPTCDASVVAGEIRSDHGHRTHFLPNHVLIIEGLVRLAAAPATGLFVGLPLKIKGGSGSPIRAVLIAEAEP